MRRTRARHVGRSVLSGATTPNRNGLVMPGFLLSVIGEITCQPPVKVMIISFGTSRDIDYGSTRNSSVQPCGSYTMGRQGRFRGHIRDIRTDGGHPGLNQGPDT